MKLSSAKNGFVLFCAIIIFSFALTGLDFDDLTIQNNKRSYVMFFVFSLMVIFFFYNKKK